MGEYVFDSQGGRHQAFVYPVCETNVLGSVIGANERVMIEQSFKYSHSEASELWRRGGFCEKHESFRGDNHGETMWLLVSFLVLVLINICQRFVYCTLPSSPSVPHPASTPALPCQHCMIGKLSGMPGIQ